jgi:hypothetical protein
MTKQLKAILIQLTKEKDALEKSVFQLSETLKKCEPEDLGGRYFFAGVVSANRNNFVNL